MFNLKCLRKVKNDKKVQTKCKVVHECRVNNVHLTAVPSVKQNFERKTAMYSNFHIVIDRYDLKKSHINILLTAMYIVLTIQSVCFVLWNIVCNETFKRKYLSNT